MANVSSSNGIEQYPQLRFCGFTDQWNSINFNNLFTYIPNNTLSRAELNYDAGEYKNVHYGDVLIKFGPVLDAASDELPFVTDASTKKLGNVVLMDGDVIIADTAEDEAVGKATEIINVGDQQIVSGLHTIACRPTIKLSPTYLGFYLNAETYHKQLYALMQGVKVLSISKSNIGDTVIRYPTPLEQKRICDLLNLLEARITKQGKLIEHLKKYKRGLNISLIAEIPPSFNKQLIEVCRIVGGGTPDTLIKEYWDGNIHWFTPSEVGKTKYVSSSVRRITNMGVAKSSAKILPKNTILLTTRATLGEMSILQEEGTTNQGFQSLVASNEILPEYIYYLQVIIKSWCEKYASGNTFREISKAALGKCIIPVPDRSIQLSIVKVLAKFDDRINVEEAMLEKLLLAKKAFLQQLFV